jgi:hypothetical protein
MFSPQVPILTLAGAILSGFLLACIPWPTRYQAAPTVTGAVLNGGVPVPDAEVTMVTGWDTTQSPTRRVRTDSLGQFRMEGSRKTRWLRWLLPPMDESVAFRLQVHDTAGALLWGGRFTDAWEVRHSYHLSCDLVVVPADSLCIATPVGDSGCAGGA